MLQHLFKSRKILAAILVAALALVQVKIAFAGCLTAEFDSPPAVAMAMDDCPGCSTSGNENSGDSLSRICGNQCLYSYVSCEKVPAQPLPATAAIALVDAAAAPPLILPHERTSFSGKSRLIYRLQRLLI